MALLTRTPAGSLPLCRSTSWRSCLPSLGGGLVVFCWWKHTQQSMSCRASNKQRHFSILICARAGEHPVRSMSATVADQRGVALRLSTTLARCCLLWELLVGLMLSGSGGPPLIQGRSRSTSPCRAAVSAAMTQTGLRRSSALGPRQRGPLACRSDHPMWIGPVLSGSGVASSVLPVASETKMPV